MRNKTVNIYTEWLPLIESLPNEIAGVIFKNILKYQNGENIENSFPVWVFIKAKIDEYNSKYKQISEKRKENGKLGGLAKASKCQQVLANDGKSSNKIKENKINNNNNINILNINNNKFIKPSIDEVRAYCLERNNGIDAEKWYNHYTSNGWKVGKNPMKDWKAAVRTWEREKNNTKQEKTVVIESGKFYIDYDADDYKDLFMDVIDKQELANKVWDWIYRKFEFQEVKVSFIRNMIEKFKKGI